MANPTPGAERAESHFPKQLDRYEKGSAMGLIKAEAKATQEKSARLRAMRLAQEAEEVKAPAKKKPVAKARATAKAPAKAPKKKSAAA